MKKYFWGGVLVISLITWLPIAEAASISTRVRILESKVAKQDNVIKQQASSQKKSAESLALGLKQVEDLKSQVELFMKQQKQQAAKEDKPVTDKRYAFP